MSLLGIDVGTTTLKAGLYGDDGSVQATVLHEYGQLFAFHPDDLWSGLRAAIAKALAAVPSAEIRAVAISSHGESVVPLDERGRPLSAFIVNTDCRGVEEAAAFSRQFGKMALFERTGLPVHPMYTLIKLAHLKASDPGLFAQAKRFRCVEDWILERAGVGAFISASLASRTMAMDLSAATWAADLTAFAGVDERALSRLTHSGTPLGYASPQAAAELGLPAGALVGRRRSRPGLLLARRRRLAGPGRRRRHRHLRVHFALGRPAVPDRRRPRASTSRPSGTRRPAASSPRSTAPAESSSNGSATS